MRAHLPHWIIAWTCIYSGAAMAQSLCAPNERIMFSCPLTQSKKIVSLCASQNISPAIGYLQYRFGTAKDTELVYPLGKAHPKGNFELFHIQYVRASSYGVSFKLRGYEYSLSYMASGPDPKDDEYQLTATLDKSDDPKFEDACDKSHIVGKTAFYPLESLSRKLGLEIVEIADDK